MRKNQKSRTTATSPTSDGNEYTRIISHGREVYWRYTEENAFEVHTGDETKTIVIDSWDRAQDYLDGKAACL